MPYRAICPACHARLGRRGSLRSDMRCPECRVVLCQRPAIPRLNRYVMAGFCLAAVAAGWFATDTGAAAAVTCLLLLSSTYVLVLLALWPYVVSYEMPGHAAPARCRICGYDLRATPDRCPECGTPAGKGTS